MRFIRNWYLKKELEKIEYFRHNDDEERRFKWDKLAKAEERQKFSKMKYQKERRDWTRKGKEEYIKQLGIELEENKRGLKKIIDLDLVPGKKVWAFEEYTMTKPHKLEIENIVITKDKIIINGGGREFFKTKKEAIDYHNNRLNSLKL